MENELNSSLFILEMTGLQYFSLKLLVKDNSKDKITKYRLVYMVFLFFFVLTFVIAFVMADNIFVIESLTAKNVVMFAIQNSVNFGLILVVCTSFIQSYTSTEHIKKFYLNTKEISRLCLQEFKVSIDFKKIKFSIWKRLTLMMTFFLSLHIIVGFFHIKYLNEVYVLFVGMIPLLFFLMIVFKLTFYVELINRHLEFLEKLVSDISMYQPIKIIDNINFHLVTVKTVKPVKQPEDPLRKFQITRKVYNLIYENGVLINDSNGLTLLILLACTVVSLTTCGYTAFVIIVGGLPTKKAPGTCISCDCITKSISIY